MVETVFRPQVPPGHIYVNDKWKNSELFTFLNRRVQTIMIDSMDFVDFYPSTEFAVIFVTEADLVAGINYRRNLAKLKKANYEKSAVIVEKTSISNQYFGGFQKFAVIELGLGIVPVSGPDECCQALVAMVRMGSEDKSNPFMLRPRVPPLETYLLKTLLTVPSLGETKAQALLLKYKSLINICNASLEELTKIIGASSAQQVYNFFHSC
ncbi:fanconi anemia core complex-associated protein 24 [Trichonephila inaurata madagascariensis]|uniref:Fanconi anemia core complex-associated protein 24 n=1 Tax=Trichonephila inaurata madagascariensis TaxID=2747483 RepID=A0A8X6XK87_9ARAC|nr:fanconi anemia core complex-associated protein 24 [Trichonephila inaurata madagascariensis]